MSESRAYKISEITMICDISKDQLIHFINERWVFPADQEEVSFDHEDIERIRLIENLQNEFGVNDDAVPIILHLIDQLNHLHQKIKKNH
jgi:chaperone modulatory protein CbpM